MRGCAASGRGGQAVVYSAIKENTGRKVAIKVWRDRRERFDREMEILAKLDHPNIVRVIDCGLTPSGSPYLAMDFVEGKALDKYLAEGMRPTAHFGAVPARGEMMALFRKICDAVHAAHLQQVIHRDLKPSNILIDERGEPHIVDFGVARNLLPDFNQQRLTITDQFLGTLAWASPEQAASGEVDARTDVYSLGLILYYMLTGGQFPYNVLGPIVEVLNNIRLAAPTPPSKALAPNPGQTCAARSGIRPAEPALNPLVEFIVLKALSKDRELRYANAGELCRAIDDYLSGAVTKPPVARPKIRRTRARMLALMGLCAVIAGTYVAWRFRRPIAMPAAATDPQQRHDQAQRTFTNSLGMKFVRIEPGAFIMGSRADEPEHDPFDGPQHRVTLTRAFYMGIHHVTVKQFAAFVNATGHQTQAETGDGFTLRPDGNGYWRVGGVFWRNPGFPQGEDHPAVFISWFDANAFCAWLGKKENRRYRLPTEAQWEYTCRANTQTAFPWGDARDGGKEFANVADQDFKARFPKFPWPTFDFSDGFVFTSPVSALKPNAFGLYDMIGNAWQWCGDSCEPCQPGVAVDPAPPETDANARRILRGGAFDTISSQCRSARRFNVSPYITNWDVGFRVVLDAP